MEPSTHKFRKAMRPRDIGNTVACFLLEGNMDAIVSMFHPDCVVCFPPGAPPSKGLERVREIFAPFIELRPRMTSTVTGELIHGDTALIQADWRIEAPDGSIMAKGCSTEVAKQKEDGSWVYYMDCPNGPPTT